MAVSDEWPWLKIYARRIRIAFIFYNSFQRNSYIHVMSVQVGAFVTGTNIILN